MKYQPPYGMEATLPNASYINGDPTIGQQGSIPPAASIEFPQRELVNFITKSDIVPSDNDLMQLTRGIRSQFVNFAVDTGAINVMAVALDPPLAEYKQGFPLRVLCATNNTGPTSISVNGMATRPVKRAGGADLEIGDLRAGMIANMVDDGTNFQLTNYLGIDTTTITTNNYTIDIPYAQDSGAGSPNVIYASFTPAITTVANGDLILVRVNSANVTAVLIAINGLPATYVMRNDGQHLQQNDLLAGETILLEWNYSFWQMMRLVRSQVFFKLIGNLLLYVRPDGSDANNGSANTPESAFRTIQAAINYVTASYVIAGRTVTISLGVPGSYLGAVSIANTPGTIIIYGGDPAAPAAAAPLSYIVQRNAGQAGTTIAMSGSGTNVQLTRFAIATIDNYYNFIDCGQGASCSISEFAWTGQSGVGQCISSYGGSVQCSGNLYLYVSVGSFFWMHTGGALQIGDWTTNVYTNGVSFAYAFLVCTNLSSALISYGYCSFPHSAIGKKYELYLNCNAYTKSGGYEDFFPGNQPGTRDNSSTYA